MRFLSNIIALTTITIILFVPFFSGSAEFQEGELTRAIQFFDKRQYEEAEKLFEKLLEERPDDFMINYFYGACRTENGHYSDRDLAYLLKASKEVSPLDIDYYFGVQYQAKNEWEKALSYYGIFGKTADETEQNRVNLSEKIQQCKNQINPFVREAEIRNDSINENTHLADKIPVGETNDSLNSNKPEMLLEDTTKTISANNSGFETTIYKQPTETDSTKSDTVEQAPKPSSTVDLPIDFSINSDITYKKLSDFRTSEGKLLFGQGNNKQKELDVVLGTAKNLRNNYASTINRTVKDSIGQQILGLEGRSYDLKNEINQFYTEAKQAENEYWNKATEDEKATFLAMLNKPEKKENVEPLTIEDSSDLEIPEILVDNSVPFAKSAEPANKDLTYKIQIGAYSRGLPISVKKLFDKLSFIRKIENYTDDKGVVVYTTGNLTNFDDAMTMLKQVQQEGVEDAIIAAYFKGKRIPLTEAKEIEGIK